MYFSVSLLPLAPSSVLTSTAFPRWQEMHLYAPLQRLYPGSLSCLGAAHALFLNRVPDVVIGLCCLTIAATLISFIIGAGKLLPFRYPFMILAAIVTICGFTHMTAAALPANPHVWVAAYLSFLATVLALLIACLLPFVLPYVLSVLRALPQSGVPEPQPSGLSIVPQSAPPPIAPPTPQHGLEATRLDGLQPVPLNGTQPAPPSGPELNGAQSASANLRASGSGPQQGDARLIAATESSLDAFFIFESLRDTDGKVDDFTFKWLNQNGETLLKRSREEILGLRLSQLLPLDPAPKTFEHYRLVLLTGKPYIHEFPLKEDNVYGTWMRHHVVKLEDGIAITVTDITERKHSEQYLLHLTQHDGLTGLPTRALLDDRIVQAIARANRYRSKVAAFLINLDSFGQINDLYNRSFGDQVIVTVAKRLRSAIRCTDTIVRLGGDEFVVVMSDIALATDIRRAAATLVAVLLDPIAVDDKTIQITCSLGISVYPDTAATVQDLLSGADVAMYRAKSQGKNKYVVFEPAPEDELPHLAV